MRPFALVALLSIGLGACGDRKPPPRRKVAALPAKTATTSAAQVAPSASAAPPPSAKIVTSAWAPPRAGACRSIKGPIQLPFRGPVAMHLDADAPPDTPPQVIFNRNGAPHAATIPKTPSPVASASASAKAGKPERLALTDPPERATVPACIPAGKALFCADENGGIHRTPRAGGSSTLVAQARSGASLAASTIGDHTVFAFLADRKTSEGAVTLAFAGVDDNTPELLSEEGSGATFVTLVPRRDTVVAVYIDARRALTPVHARVLRYETKLDIGPDAVLFVGEGTDGRTGTALAQAPGGGVFALFPIYKDVTNFGLAAIRVDDVPRVDADVTWSSYPAGIDAPPVAAAVGAPSRVARVRPASASPDDKTRVLELGDLEGAGAFKPLCTAVEGKVLKDPSLLVDGAGTTWLVYTDADGTWIDRFAR